MQIVETASDGLKRSYTVTIRASDIASRVDGEVKRLTPQVRMPGFRPGKVPANLVKKMHGAQLQQDALNTSIREAMDRLVAEKQLRPAMQPQVSLGETYTPGSDVELAVDLEVLPQITAPVLDGMKLEKLVVPVSDEAVQESLDRLAGQQKSFTDAGEGREAETGDQLVVDFVGKRDGVPFDGGSATGQAIELGAGRLIPGFEEQLVGARTGEERQIAVTFPADYPAKELAGKQATFDITVHQVKVPGEMVVDDDFAKQLGLEGLDQLKGLLRGQLEQESAGQTRTQMKRALLDQLAAGHDFAVPPSMVEAEFQQIMGQLKHEAGHEPDPEAALQEIESEAGDYRSIAERRVRLGLLLSEIGQANGVEVSNQEMQRLVAQAAQQYREADRQRFVEYVQNDPMAAAQLRAPLYEDKVVDFLIGKAEVSERAVSAEELQAAIEAEEPHVHGPGCGHDHADEPAKATAKPKRADAEVIEGSDEAAKPAKKPAKKVKATDAASDEGAADAGDTEAPARKSAARKAPARKAAAQD